MAEELGEADRGYLRMAVNLSRGYLDDQRRWPFGAIVVVDGHIVGRGVNEVVERNDPAAHAEVMALRTAGAALGRHAFEDGTLYSSSEPCPMCLAACYWACLKRVVFAATSADVADCGLRDLAIYDQLKLSASRRSLQEDHGEEDLRRDATAILRDWAQRGDT
jgi:tRNA(Arg) A34 adenosine deaminase TadA